MVGTSSRPAFRGGAPWSRADARMVAYVAATGSLALAALGSVEHAHVFALAGAGLGLVLVALLAPQVVLALFLVAAGVKAAPSLAVFPFDLTVATGVGVLIAMTVRATSSKHGLLTPPPAVVLALLLGVLIVLGAIWTPAPARGLDLALRFETLTMIAFFSPFVLIRNREELIRLAVALVVLSSAIALTAVKTGNVSTPLTIAGSQDEVDLALYTSLGIFASIGFLVLVTRRPWRYLWIVPAAICATTVVESGSRGVLIATSLALLVAAGFAIARARHPAITALGLVLIFIGIATAGSQLFGPAAQKYRQGLLTGNSSLVLGKRNFLLDYGKQIALAHPLGLGISGYKAVTGYVYPHNALLEAADEEGIIGLGLLLALIIAAWRSGRRAAAGRVSPEAVFAATLLVVMVGEAMFSTTFTQNRLLWFALGLALAVPNIAPVSRIGPARVPR